MNIDALRKRLEKLDSQKTKRLSVVQVTAPPEPDITLIQGADLVIVRRIVER